MRTFLAGLLSIMTMGTAHAQFSELNKWAVDRTTDPVTDDVRVTAGIVIEEGLHLTFQCLAGHFGTAVSPVNPEATMAFSTTDPSAEVSWQVDDAPAVTERWRVIHAREGNQTVLVRRKTDQMVRAVVGANEHLVLRVHGVTGVFSVEDAENYVQPVLSACNIPAP